MITDPSIKAGSVVWYKFDSDTAAAGEMTKRRPALVVSPTTARRFRGQMYRTAYIVPLTSRADNGLNENAIEIFHPELNANSDTKRTFAICNLALSVSLDSDRIELYRGKQTGNKSIAPTIRGDQLDLIVGRVIQLMCGERRFRRFANGYLKSLPKLIRKRQDLSRDPFSAARAGKRKGGQGGYKSHVLKKRNRQNGIGATPSLPPPRPTRKSYRPHH